MKRSIELNKVEENKRWEVIVIGGGATGLGVAIDAANRGFKTILLEAHDFAKGTSSRSTKLVHGGVRYLAQGHIDLVREALRERGLLAQNAAHLVESQSFVIPSYNWVDSFMYRIGLGLYDRFSGKLSLGDTEFISKDTTVKKLPTIKTDHLRNGVVYYDGQFDDARLAVNMAQTIVEQGGCVLNYAEVIDLLEDENNKVIGVVFKDQLSGKTYEILSDVVINATGVFTNAILQMDEKTDRKFVVPSQGIHLVLDRSFMPSEDALMIPKTSDGRVLFAVPWHDKLVVGTTDVLVEDASLEPEPLQREVDFILQTATNYLIKKPTRKDVLSVFAGLRPLAAPEKEGQSTKEVSRSHKIIVSESGLVTITGGKWTTFRQMAEDTVNKALKVHGIAMRPCQTKHLSIHGNLPENEVDRDELLSQYGSDKPLVQAIQKESVETTEKIHPNYDYTVAEVIWAVREEMAITVEDVLARRIRLLFLDAKAAIDCAPKVAEIMAKELDKDQIWIDHQVETFIALAQNYLLH